MRTEHTIASTYFKRALELGERIGNDRPTKLLVTGNLGDIAARNGELQEAATWLTESLALSEQTSNREHTSWGLVTLATVQQDLGDLRGALENIRRALAAARNIKSTTRVGFALVALANWRVARALLLGQQDGSAPLNHASMRQAHPECLRLLCSARAAIERAQHLTDIDTETECTGQVVLTAIYYYLGDLERAQQQALKALEETRLSEMVHLIGRAQRLLGEIQAARGLEQEADSSFSLALQIFKEHGLRLDYARTLHRYGNCLLARSLQVKSARATSSSSGVHLTRRGLDYLREAHDIFATCQANLDLQWVEHTLTDPRFLHEEV
jgi:tetratricopeptide (TPR) repeat protein